MRGSIRFFVGFLMAFGAVGGLDNPETSLLVAMSMALVGLAVMASGVSAMKAVR